MPGIRARLGFRTLEQASKPAAPSTGTRHLYAKADGWYEQDAAGTEVRLSGAAGANPEVLSNASTSLTTFAAADLYVPGSNLVLPSRLRVGSMYRFKMQLTKTSTTGSTATPIVTIRTGTTGSLSDAARVTLTFAAQTAVADVGMIDLYCIFRAVGASAVLTAVGHLDHQLSSTGLSTSNASIVRATPAAFDITPAGTQIGVSFNGGASFAGNSELAHGELLGLAA